MFCSREQPFLSLFVCFECGNGISSFFSFVLEVEMMFLVAFGLWGKEKPCFFSLVKFIGRRNTVSIGLDL